VRPGSIPDSLGVGIAALAQDHGGDVVAVQLARDGRRLAIQSCSDFPDRLPAFMKTGNLTPFLDRELAITGHGNTCLWCCTSFVNSEGSTFPSLAEQEEGGCRIKSGMTRCGRVRPKRL
jgi:hypothetical protein